MRITVDNSVGYSVGESTLEHEPNGFYYRIEQETEHLYLLTDLPEGGRVLLDVHEGFEGYQPGLVGVWRSAPLPLTITIEDDK